MSGKQTAYSVLGLRPGAKRADVDEAYRRLIKLYHPDRTGGDCSRAAEINRAYTVLRRDQPAPIQQRRRQVPVPVRPRAAPPRRRAGWLVAGAVAAAGGFALANDIPQRAAGVGAYVDPLQWAAPPPQPTQAPIAAPLASFDEPLQTGLIDQAVADALKLHQEADPAAAAAFSRACHATLRDEPSIAWFDSCAAFDEATVVLAGNPFGESGPFDASSVMARQMGAARALSQDMLAADSRLHQIRSRVELAVMPRLDEAAAYKP